MSESILHLTRRFDAQAGTAQRRLLLLLVVGCLVKMTGCAAFHPINGVPVAYLPVEYRGESRSDRRTIDLSLLTKSSGFEHKVGPRDVLSIYIPGVLGGLSQVDDEVGETPPINLPVLEQDNPTIGFPVTVRDDGTISLPQIEPVPVAGMTLAEVEQAVLREYTVNRSVLRSRNARVIVSVLRPREHRVLIVRQEQSGEVQTNVQAGTVNVGKSKRGVARVVSLRPDENDVLHALAKAEPGADGLPGLDAENTLYIIKRRHRQQFMLPEMCPPGPVIIPPMPGMIVPPSHQEVSHQDVSQQAQALIGRVVRGQSPADMPQSTRNRPVWPPQELAGQVNGGIPTRSRAASPFSTYRQTEPTAGLPAPPTVTNAPKCLIPPQPVSSPVVPPQPDTSQLQRVAAIAPPVDVTPLPLTDESPSSDETEQVMLLDPPQAEVAQRQPIWQLAPAVEPGPVTETMIDTQPVLKPQPTMEVQPVVEQLVPATPADMVPLAEAGHDFAWQNTMGGFDPTIDSPHVIKIPIRLKEGQIPHFTERDITLEDGDIIFIEARDTEVFYTAGLLGGGQQMLPRDYDLRVLGAVSIALSQNNGNQSGRAVGGVSSLNQDVTVSASNLVILRTLPDGKRVNISVDLNRAKSHPEQDILILPGDHLVLQYTRWEAFGAFFERHLLEGALFGVAASNLNRNGN